MTALIIETGDGLNAEANTYATRDSFIDQYHADRGNAAWAAALEADRDSAIFRGMDWLESRMWRGYRQSSTQPLAFPRFDIFDELGRQYTGVPREVLKALAEASLRALTIQLEADRERGGAVSSITAGSVSITWENGAPAGTTYPAIVAMLRRFIYGGAQAPVERG